MSRFLALLALFFSISVMGVLAQNFTIDGTILDDENTPVIGAVIAVKERPSLGSVSNDSGYFSLSLPQSKWTIVVNYMGFKTIEKVVNVNDNKRFEFTLESDAQSIDEVVIESRRADERVASTQIGVERIEISELAKTPALFGERDIIKSMTLLPGVKAEGDGSSGFQVRGGTASQNLILLDDAPIYNAGHAIGIFSVFNDEALSNASLYKGQIPAQFGGATSSVFDIDTKTGDRQDYHYGVNIGALFAKASAEGPIARDKASFFVSARRSYFDVFLKADEQYKDNIINFYDVNAKLSYSLNDNNIFSASLFIGQDNMGLDDLMSMNWGNKSATLKWFHKYNDRFNSNTSLIWSTFQTEMGMDILETEVNFEGFINNYALRHNFNYTPNEKLNFQAGVQSKLIDLKSAQWEVNGFLENERRDAWENNAWLNGEWKMNARWSFSAGLRLNAFTALGGAPYYELDGNGDIVNILDYGSGDEVETYLNLEPRASVNMRLDSFQSIKAGYSRTSQNVHAIRSSSMSSPFDRYTMSSNIIKPQVADQVSVGYMRLSRDKKYEFSVEAYYKSIDDIYDYKNGKSFSSEIEIERIILGGDGRAYGVEMLAKKNSGRFTGWLSYTLSWSENRIEGISDGEWYTAGNDRRHDVSLVGMYELSPNWDMAATWVYNTGQALTAPSAKYEINGETVYYYAEKNGYRAPSYHRFDVSFTNTKEKKNYTRVWNLGVYNLYGRYNPYMIIFEDDATKPSGSKATQYSLFGILPSVSFGIKF